MIRWNLPEIARLMEARGIANRKQLGERAGLSLPTAYNVTSSGPLTRVDVPLLERLATVLKPARIWDLLDHTPDP